MKPLLREPLLHFLLIGAVIFVIHAWRGGEGGSRDALPRIEVNSAILDRLSKSFLLQWHRPPDEDEIRGLVNEHVREEVLYREAIAMGLDRDDTIVRRRMAQKMEFLTQDIAAAAEPDETTLREYYNKNTERYSKGVRISFRHIFFSKERRGTKMNAGAQEALIALAAGASDETMGDPFLREYEFHDAGIDEIATALGREFADQLIAMSPGEWRGPVASSYGSHLVRVKERREPQALDFETVRDSVTRDLLDERRRTSNTGFLEGLKAQYVIVVDEAALRAASESSSKTAAR